MHDCLVVLYRLRNAAGRREGKQQVAADLDVAMTPAPRSRRDCRSRLLSLTIVLLGARLGDSTSSIQSWHSTESNEYIARALETVSWSGLPVYFEPPDLCVTIPGGSAEDVWNYLATGNLEFNNLGSAAGGERSLLDFVNVST